VSAPADAALSLRGLTKTYKGGHVALKPTDLDVRRGEIFALLGPNGAGKTTLISAVCGIVTPSAGTIRVAGHDALADPKAARRLVGLVPQELVTDAFESVWATVSFSRRLFGRAADPALVERVLRDLSLWDKRASRIMELSGGMKRRVLIAKALAHEPELLFLDEPSAGVDVELRRDMWRHVRALRERGVTIVLTTHYIEEAEEMADRVGVIRGGELLLVDDKDALMNKLGRREAAATLAEAATAVPDVFAGWPVQLEDGGRTLRYRFDADGAGVPAFVEALRTGGIAYTDLETKRSSLEDIFVELVGQESPK